MCERGELETRHYPPYYNAIFTTFASIDLRLEYKREISLISDPPKFEACDEVEARGMVVSVTRTHSNLGSARV